ncbi:MAG TPA: phage holin family protein [Burkholderiales bacterium]|jgi:Protein of unknown function (DUF1469).
MAVSADELTRQHQAALEAASPEYRARFDAARNEPLEGHFDFLWRTARRVAHGHALLAVLDMRRASIQLAWLIGTGVVIAVLGVTAWLTAVTALVTWLLEENMSLPLVLLIAAVINLAGAGILVWRIKALVAEMPFAATLRQLKGEAPESELKQ